MDTLIKPGSKCLLFSSVQNVSISCCYITMGIGQIA